MMRRDYTGLLAHAFLMVAALCFLGPFVWIALAAFKTQIVLLTSQIWFHPILRNFYDVLFSGDVRLSAPVCRQPDHRGRQYVA